MKKRIVFFGMIMFACATAALAQDSLTVKDGDGNVLMQVNDEGTVGSITLLPGIVAPGTVTNKLYSVNDSLFFSGVFLGGPSPWTVSGSDIFYNTGNVGIGTAGPGAIIHVEQSGSARSDGTFRFIQPSLSSGNDNSILFGRKGAVGEGGLLGYKYNSTTSESFIFLNHWGDSPGSGSGMALKKGGNVGIGTNDPDEELHVVGNIKMVDSNQSAGRVLTSDAGGVGSWADLPASSSQWTDIGNSLHPADNSGNENIFIGGATAGTADILLGRDGGADFNTQENDVDFRVRGDTQTNLFYVDASVDRVGIGTNTPAAKAEITAGNNDGLLVSGTASANNIVMALKNTNTGGREWDLMSTGGASGIGQGKFVIRDQTGTANRLVIDNAGNVGIGEMTPSAKFDVVGTTELNGNVDINSDLDVDGGTLHVDGTKDNVGVGTATPDTSLHVVGNIKMVDGNEAAGKVLTSDANGIGSWQTASGGAAKDMAKMTRDAAQSIASGTPVKKILFDNEEFDIGGMC
jgi:hypothetical protein